MKFYHNPRCSKSRQALALLEGQEIEVIEYLKNTPSIAELEEICKKCKIEPIELLRTKEDIYKELVSKEGLPDGQKALIWMNKYPKLIERPILIKENKGALGRPPENVLKI